MARYLFVVPPLVGHVNPASAVATELESRGHEVAWVAHASLVGELLGPSARIYPAGDGFVAGVTEHLPERRHLRGPAALTFLWERVLLPLARHMAGPVRVAVDDFEPDLVVADQQAFAGSIVAAERGLPWAVSAATTADLGRPVALLPKIGEWMQRHVEDLCVELGAAGLGADGFDPRYSPHLMLVYSVPGLVGEAVGAELPVEFVGPVVREDLTPTPFPWEWLDRHDVNLYVSLGTVSFDVGEGFLRRAVEAVADRPYGAVVIGPAAWQDAAPANVLMREWVPQVELLPHIDAVVCHAGHNTSVGALTAGVPVVCAPIRDDQPIIAAQVVHAGAGVRIGFSRARPDEIAAAVQTVLDEPSYRQSAGRIADALRTAGGAPAAADHLEALVSRHDPVRPT